jgi:hypothetical protein
MKKITPLILILLITQSLFSQMKYVESDTDSYIDFTNQKVKLTYNEYSIEGNYTKVDGNYGYMIVDGGESVWIISHQSNYGIRGMDILKGDYKTILKEFKKKRNYKKSILLFSNLPSEEVMDGYKLITQTQIELNEKLKKLEDKKKELSMKFDSEISNSELLGVYKIKILKHRNLDYKNTETYGKLYVTEVGITVETEIPSLGLLRGSYDKGNTNVEKGRFVCNISKGYGDLFSISLNKENKVGGLTTIDGTTSTTTIFTIVD